MHQGNFEMGCVYAPLLQELYFAQKGCGAFLNGKAIHVSSREKLEDATAATGFACIRAGLKRNNLPCFSAIVQQVRDIRRYGSAALDLCFVA